MKNTLWTFGCSFTAEWFPVGMNGITSGYDLYKNWRGGNLPDVWPTILANKLNMNLSNVGIGGNSNYGIMHQFIDVCDSIKENDILIFGWTQVARFVAANFKVDIFNHVLPCDTDYSGTYLSNRSIEEIFYNRTHNLWITEIHKWIYLINSFCKSKKVQVYHWTSDDLIFDNNTNFVKDDRRFIIPKDKNNPTYTMMGFLTSPLHYGNREIARISQETNNEVDDIHLGEYGHKMQSEYFYDHIIGIDYENKTYSI